MSNLTCDTFGRPVRRRLTDLRFHSSHGVICALTGAVRWLSGLYERRRQPAGRPRNRLERICRMPSDYIAIEVNGHAADEAAVSLLEHEGWGHFTAMQVRRGRTRGLDLHLSRLEAAHRDV